MAREGSLPARQAWWGEGDMAVVKALLGGLMLIGVLGGLGAALEWAAPEPGAHYASLPPTARSDPHPGHPQPPCYLP